MTQPAPQQFKSALSGRLVVPGWMNLVPGKAVVRVEAKGFKPWTEDVDVAAGERLVLAPTLEKEKVETAPVERPTPPPANNNTPPQAAVVEPPKPKEIGRAHV